VGKGGPIILAPARKGEKERPGSQGRCLVGEEGTPLACGGPGLPLGEKGKKRSALHHHG